jgi:hypothetical protein
MKVAAVLAASLGLGLVMTSCSSGPNTTDIAACNAILKVTLPPGLGEPMNGSEIGIALPATLTKNLTHSGDPTLARYGRALTSASGKSFVKAFDGAQNECRKVGA